MKTKLIAAVVLVVIIAALGVLSLGERHPAELKTADEEKPVVTIGFILPLSGKNAAVGRGLQAAAQLAVNDLSGRHLNNEYHFLFEDDAYEPKKTIAAFTRLQHAERAKAVVTFSAQAGSVVNNLAETGAVIQFNIGSAEPSIARGRYNFIHWTQPEETTAAILDLYRRNGYQKVAVISQKISESLAAESAFRKNLLDYPEISAKYYRTKPTEDDFRMTLSFIRNYEPDVILALVPAKRAENLIRQYRAARIPYPLTNVASFGRIDDLSRANDLFFSDVAPTADTLEKRMYLQNAGLSTYGAGNIYDAVMLLVDAFENAASADSAVDILASQRYYEGMLGQLRLDGEGVFHSPAVIKTIKNGRYELVK